MQEVISLLPQHRPLTLISFNNSHIFNYMHMWGLANVITVLRTVRETCTLDSSIKIKHDS